MSLFIMSSFHRKLLAQYQAKTHFKDTAALLSHLQRTAETYSTHAIDLAAGPPACAVCGGEAVNRCGGCKLEWYCGRVCQVKAWKEHKPLCTQMSAAEKKENKNE